MVEDIRIYFIGDSYINGTGDPKFLGWPGRVCAASQSDQVAITGYNLGIRADTSADVLPRWENEVAARRLKPHDGRIVFGFGANDCWIEDGIPRIGRAESEKNIEHILSLAVGRLPTLMIGPPPGVNAEQDALRQDMSDLLQAICLQVGVAYLSVIDNLRDGKIWQKEALQGDQIHPSSGGYTHMAQLVLGWSDWWFNTGSDE